MVYILNLAMALSASRTFIHAVEAFPVALKSREDHADPRGYVSYLTYYTPSFLPYTNDTAI